ncbi:hypothetical protein GQX74_012837 [Glossina fuscipes]|uniref:Uncharacterized protein n=1 Tax=Glossina palpalis gambiensis TaxID=67801 RepID=A0A1B0C6N5_9MUSC|nr:hypothetical protein GQX74_012837 [Glossina fuscipes]
MKLLLKRPNNELLRGMRLVDFAGLKPRNSRHKLQLQSLVHYIKPMQILYYEYKCSIMNIL